MKSSIHTISRSTLVTTGLVMALCFVGNCLVGQTLTATAFIDKPFYVSGEILWYKVYLPEQFKDRERVIRVALTDDQGRLVHEHHLRNAGSASVDGYYKIPYDCPTGNYRLAFSGVKKFINQNVELVAVVVPFYNDFEVVNAATQQSTAVTQPSGMMANDLNVRIQPGMAGPRQKQSVQITVTDQAGDPVTADLAISVVDSDIVPPARITTGKEIGYGVVEQTLENEVYVKGNVKNLRGEPVQVNVLGAFSPADNRVNYSKSDAYGNFAIKMPQFTGERQVQFLGFQDEIAQIQVDVSKETQNAQVLPAAHFSPDVLEYLELSRKRKQIFKYFTVLEQSITPRHLPIDRQEFEPDFQFHVAKYEDFDFVKDFFGELITPLTFKLSDTSYVANMANPKGRNLEDTNLKGTPLFIVDGKLTRNADFIARMDMTPIERIELFYDPYKLRRYFNAVGKSGVARIITKLPETPLPKLDMNNVTQAAGFLAEADFPVLSNTDFEDAVAPVLRPQLYWNPDVTTDANGNYSAEYMQSDDLTSYRVTVVAQDGSGRRGTAQATYTVKVER